MQQTGDTPDDSSGGERSANSSVDVDTANSAASEREVAVRCQAVIHRAMREHGEAAELFDRAGLAIDETVVLLFSPLHRC